MNFVRFTKRTEDPKLGYLEKLLATHGIASRRNGSSFHAPILEVPEADLDRAWALLDPIDDIEDDDPRWNDDPPGTDEWVDHWGPWYPGGPRRDGGCF